MLGVKHTTRGFPYYRFLDRNGEECSLQESSVATEPMIWLGIDDPSPVIMARDAKKLGLNPSTEVGWVPYKIPEEVLVTTRMHLTQERVRELLPILQKFAETGEIT